MINERIVKLTIEENRGFHTRRQTFIISLGENGAEIRRGNAPVVDRDQTAVAYVGDPDAPEPKALLLRVEEQV